MAHAKGADGEAQAAQGDREPPPDPVGALEGRLGVALADRPVALAALTHKSYVNEHRDEVGLADNERLEFLGDAVIDLAVSHRLMQKFPGAREGDLSKMRAAVVDEQGLAEMARALDLGPLLRLGRGEELTGGRRKSSLLADAMEAVVAAVYVCGGLEPVLALIDRFLGEAFARAAAGTLDRDYKTQLQELAQSRLRSTPRYRVIRELGPDHSKTFEVETDLRGEVVGRGAGRSKKDAEQAAARFALEALARRFADDAQPAACPPEPAPAGGAPAGPASAVGPPAGPAGAAAQPEAPLEAPAPAGAPPPAPPAAAPPAEGPAPATAGDGAATAAPRPRRARPPAAKPARAQKAPRPRKPAGRKRKGAAAPARKGTRRRT
jgi:ribonuclease-3